MANRLKVAIQKSGRLTDNSLDLLARCGLKYSRSKDRLICVGENMPVDVLLVRDDDIPALVYEGVCHLGVVGLNVLEEQQLAAAGGEPGEFVRRLRPLEFGYCRLSIAAPAATEYAGIHDLHGKRVATSYPHTLSAFLGERGVDCEILTLSGAVEVAPRLGRADYVCDLVSTGATLAANHLRETEVVLDSQAWLIRTPEELTGDVEDWITRLLRRVDGVTQVRESKYIMLHAPRSAVHDIARLLPGCEAPTVLPLDGSDDRVAVHAVCRETVFWETLEDLKGVGASAVLVLPVEKMLA